MYIEEVRQLAQDETTSPEKLKELSNSSDTKVLRNIVANPNVPPDVLAKLASLFPKQVFDNPAIDLLLLETPDLFSRASAMSICSLLKRTVPNSMVEYAANSTNEKLKMAILINPNISPEILDLLVASKKYDVQESANLHVNFDLGEVSMYQEFVFAKIQQIISASDKQYRAILSDVNKIIRLNSHIPHCISYYMQSSISRQKTYPKITLSEVEQLVNSGKLQLLPDIARNPNISVEIICKLLEYPYRRTEITKAISVNPATPIGILEEIAKAIHHHTVHSSIARNPQATAAILEILVNRNSYSDDEVSRHPNINKKIISKILSKSTKNYGVVFYNPNTPEKIKKGLLDYFIEKQTVPIQKYRPQEFIESNDIPGDLLEKCIVNTIEAIKNIKNPTYVRSKAYIKTYLTRLKVIAFHPNITPKGLKILLDYEDKSVRSSAISNYKVTKYITESWGISFLKTLDNNELKNLASNFYVTEEILRELVNHQDISVSRTAASNPSASDEILEEWETSPHYKPGTLGQIMMEEQRLLEQWESSISAANRLIVVLNTEAPIEVLAKISRSTSWLERYAIAQNPKTPYPIVQRLINDGNRIVKAAAQTRSDKYLKQAIK